MKKRILALFQAAVLLVAVSACGAPETENTGAQAVENPTIMNMGTGDQDGSYYTFGNLLSGYMSEASGINVDVISTDGSVENINGINEGTYQLGLAQADVMSYAWNGIRSFAKDGEVKSFRAIGGLYEEALQIVTLDETIQHVGDLRGRIVSIGAEDSGVALNAMNVLDVYGLRTGDDIHTVNLSFSDSVEAMKAGTVDAAFIVSGTPTNAIAELAVEGEVYLVNIDGEEADELLERYPYYNEHVILSGTYAGLDQDTKTVSIQATLIVSADASEEDVYNMTAGIYENTESISVILSRGVQMSVENATTGVSVPFHAGAAKYFAEKGFNVPTE